MGVGSMCALISFLSHFKAHSNSWELHWSVSSFRGRHPPPLVSPETPETPVHKNHMQKGPDPPKHVFFSHQGELRSSLSGLLCLVSATERQTLTLLLIIYNNTTPTLMKLAHYVTVNWKWNKMSFKCCLISIQLGTLQRQYIYFSNW